MNGGIADKGRFVVAVVASSVLAVSGGLAGWRAAWAQHDAQAGRDQGDSDQGQGGPAGGHQQHGGRGGGHHHESGHQAGHHRAVEACLAEFETVVGAGRGFGMAFAADQNGYPGPMHVLELKERLKLTADQEARVQALMSAMYGESRPKGARLLDAEARLRQLFADGTADEATVRTAVEAVERARSEVRLVHLITHLRTRDLLSAEQRRIYHEARWGGR
jgi:Spy/CpxP family protein refolding chaperone